MGVMSVLINVALHIDQYLGVMIQHYGGLTYFILALIIFLETALVLTPFLPGDSLLFITGAVAATKVLNVWVLFFLLSIAAILGDTVNYWIGHYFGERVFMKNRLFKKEYLTRTHEFYERHGGKTIVLARFIPIVRTFAPFVAGIGAMNYLRFLVYNIIGGFLWVGIFLLAGYYFGGIQVVKENLTLMVLGIIFVSLLPPAVVILKKNKDKLKWVVHREYFYLLSLCLVAFVFFSMITREVIGGGIFWIDKLIYGAFMSIVNPSATKIIIVITGVGDTLPMLIMSVLLFIFLLVMKRKHSAAILAFSMLAGLLLKEVVKYLIARERPIGIVAESGYSFPSGHATMAVIFFLLVIYLFKNDFKNLLLRYSFILVFSLLILAIVVSRLYLGVHWFSDVNGGVFLGLFCMSFFMIIVKAGRHYKGHIRGG